MKMLFKKQPPKIISYRDYKNYSPLTFRVDLQEALSYFDLSDISHDEFVQIVMSIVNKHVSIKLKYIRANDSPFMNREIRKAMMLCSKLCSYNKNKTLHAHHAYKNQRNYCTSLLRESKKTFYGGLDPSIISGNKKFWKVTKPFFSNKVTVSNSIALSEQDEIIEDSSKLSQLFNDLLSNAVLNLNIEENNFTNMNINEDDPILRAIYKYEQHPSIIKIKNVVGNDTHSSLSHRDNKIIINEIYSMNTSKANPQNSIPSNIMKENCDIFSEKMHTDFLHAIDLGIFPNTLKNAHVSPVFKKGGRLNICNYRPTFRS